MFGLGSLVASATPTITASEYVLKPPQLSDFRQWATLRAESEAFLQPFEPLWPRDDFTPSAFRRRLQRYRRDANGNFGHVWFIKSSDGAVLGGISLTNIRLGVAQAGTLGYWLGEAYAGQGIMGVCLVAVMNHANSHMGISRFEAATLKENHRSIRLLGRLDFVREGVAERYLRINGMWQDHLLFGRNMR